MIIKISRTHLVNFCLRVNAAIVGARTSKYAGRRKRVVNHQSRRNIARMDVVMIKILRTRMMDVRIDVAV
jgi:hypothetical protein